ncbi:MAG: VWA domain-containing protein [Myxococcota bacterium]
MSALHLVHPEWFAPLLALAATLSLFWGAAVWNSRRRRRRLLGSGGVVAHPAWRSDLALWVAAFAIGVAALGPRVGERVVRVPASGVDVVFAVDVSRSMDARDVPPSRLDRARRAVLELQARLAPQDRSALAAWAGGGVLLAPLTPDRELLAELLSALDTELIRPRSSDLAAGVRAASQAFEAGSERPRVVVLLTDGEDPERRGDTGAADAARAEVRVLALAFGSEAGATVPDHGVPLVDGGGRTVVSRRHTGRLAELARLTDGALFSADRWGALDFDAVARELRRDAGSAPGALVERRVRAVRVLPFALLAFLLLCVEGLPRVRPRVRSVPLARAAPAAAGALLLALVVAPPAPAGGDAAELDSLAELEARVRARPGDAAALVALGAGRLERGRRDAAARAFLAAALQARDPRDAAVAYFDLGVAELERQDLAAARRAFLDALAMDPGYERARFNLEWTLLALAERPPPEPSPPPPERPAPAAPPPEPVAPEEPETPEERRTEAPPPPPLSEARQRRLLERIEDDPGHALRSAARDARSESAGGAVVW